MEINPKFCIVPFTGLSISPRGVIRSCCVHTNKNMYEWSNIKDNVDTIEWPSAPIKNLQERMLSNDPINSVPECSFCWNHEKHGIKSMRNEINALVKAQSELEQLIITPKIEYLDIQFGYLCNSNCLMCYPDTSSNLHSTFQKLYNFTENQKQKMIYFKGYNHLIDNMDWPKDENAFNKLLDISRNIKALKISGGEPFFNPKFKTYLKFLASKEIKLNRIHITSNGTIFDEEIADILKTFQYVTLKFSIEGLGKQDEFIRHPAVWEEKINNITQYFKLVNPNKHVFNVCIQSLNALDIDKIIQFCKELEPSCFIETSLITNQNLASLGNSSKEYITYVLNNTTNDLVKKYANSALQYNGDIVAHANYIKDMATLQNKNLENLFPIWFRYHKDFFFH